MRYFAIAAALFAVTACSPTATEEPTAADATSVEAVATAEPAAMAADGKPTAGTYRITDADGTVSTEVLAEDGTFTSTAADGKVETGRWEQKSTDVFCVTMDAEGAKQECYNEAIDANGVWSSTDSEGSTSTVERVES